MQQLFQTTHAYEPLRKRHAEVRHSFDNAFSTRITRALSWLERAEKETEDPDAGFIFYWISFNANYSVSFIEGEGISEMARIKQFLEQIILCDKSYDIYEIMWNRFTAEIRGILNNPYIFKEFWKSVFEDSGEDWKADFEKSKKTVNLALSKQNTLVILHILFSRLYILRNQLMHGNATWKGEINRRQVTDGYKLISALQPVFLSLMIENPSRQWGNVNFPRLTR